MVAGCTPARSASWRMEVKAISSGPVDQEVRGAAQLRAEPGIDLLQIRARICLTGRQEMWSWSRVHGVGSPFF